MRCLFLVKAAFRSNELSTLDLDALAQSYGLVVTPRIRFLKRPPSNTASTSSDKLSAATADSDDEELFVRKGTLKVSEKDADEDIDINKESSMKKTKGAIAKSLFKRNIQVNQKIRFDDDEDEGDDIRTATTSDARLAGGLDIDEATRRMQEEDVKDRLTFKVRWLQI